MIYGFQVCGKDYTKLAGITTRTTMATLTMANPEAKPEKIKKPMTIPFANLRAALPRFSPQAQRDIGKLIDYRTQDNKKTVRPDHLEGIIDKDSGPEDPDRLIVQELLARKTKRKAEVSTRGPVKSARIAAHYQDYEAMYMKSGKSFTNRAEFNQHEPVQEERIKLEKLGALTPDQLKAKELMREAKSLARLTDSQQRAQEKLKALNQLATKLPKSGPSGEKPQADDESETDSDDSSDDEESTKDLP